MWIFVRFIRKLVITVFDCSYSTSLPRNVKVKLKVNSISIESENGIFLFIPFTPGQRGGLNEVPL